MTRRSPESPLQTIVGKPELLIPQRLKDIITDPNRLEVQTYPICIGRIDDEFTPTLTAAIIEREGLDQRTHDQEDPKSNWGKAINYHRQYLESLGRTTLRDKLLLMIIAHSFDHPYFLGTSGVMIHSFVIAEQLRQQRVGSSFLTNFEQMLQKAGGQYWWGQHDESSIGFFEKRGSYRKSALIPEAANGLRVGFGISGIKILDPKLEEQWVQAKVANVPQVPALVGR